MDNSSSNTAASNGGESNKINNVDLRNIPRPTRSVQPNCLAYSDENGVQQKIYLPKGTLQTACDHLENKRWDELRKFEPYTNQGYTEDDYEPIVYDDENTDNGAPNTETTNTETGNQSHA